jgi:hypothetical protein
MNREFFDVAQRIARRATEGGISINEIGDILQAEHGEVNCYPGVPSGQCHDIAYFFSFEGLLRKRGQRQNFEATLQNLIRHFQGKCGRVTGAGCVITDSWWAPNYEKWRDNTEQIRGDGVHLEFYLIGWGGWAARIEV